ncbi:PIN domain-containing protein [Candidatus Parcubacteria bacterium]|nr:PIN domain-containing protein [Patescibacteria group bacterium]MCG2693135.1 PIN domain-containing protein [Candidatus Parcubacteria bacterium]
MPALLSIAFPEIASAIARGTKNPQDALAFCRELRKLPSFVFISIDETISQLSVEIASKYFLKGADSIYVAIALKYGISLATLDKDQEKKGSKIVNIVNIK